MAKKLLTTPKGVAVYPHLSKPDTKFNKDGVYTVKVRLEGKPAEAFAKTIDDAMKANILKVKAELKEKGKNAMKLKVADAPYSRELDDEEKPTGAIVFSFKMNATGKTKTGEVFTRQPAIFNAQGTPDKTMRIGGGSTIRVSYELNPFSAPIGVGVSLRLYAVQVIELVEFGGNAEYFGFQAEEGDEAPAAAKDAADGDEEPATAAESADEF